MRVYNKSRIVGQLLFVALGITFIYYLFTPSVNSNAKVQIENRGGNSYEIYDMNKITESSDPIRNKEEVLILTPIARFYPQYWKNLLELDYPRNLISLGFIVPSSKDGAKVHRELRNAINAVQKGPGDKRFADVKILIQDSDLSSGQSEAERHKFSAQKERRGKLAATRNTLLLSTLKPSTSWVLWLDSDIVETPSTLIQDLAEHNEDVLVANCFQKQGDKLTPYDFNSWVDSQTAQELASHMDRDEILLEGYAELPTYRMLMAKIYEEHKDPSTIMALDGVGTTALLVKASVHRDGALFPTFPFYHLIESEGFAKMAKRLGHGVYGLPYYLVFHHNE
ncbi:Mannan polymerase complex subunit mnn9 [Schizosaccharomyces pombe]|uniref:Mannan polymerase complex subunit mnn9 n=1 Tax=Schizosaccharomyces pombe (strain 972 / ATCC 24843) TaxID=284812 RepID=MNN9_SCHPO|nr:putative Anp family mannosyltransferase complex subunit Mnn9 [Schizosaccharomyces pombe]O36022.1 RecName: Full=Mannan polymerase complex subunit mnn9 [Schizosaccharomyces pombe 972h-]CAB11713.1 mannosyltransferase complex subunit, Anp family Mnn9 (predicted) [Schizosaccharomyces pombe]|eukprot:NP_594753.1 putative Anp family mannosyltransferase complex subunit Mnn9 [Schizosaccharomyces pombe]